MSRKIVLAALTGVLLVVAIAGAALAQGNNPPGRDAAPQFDQRFPFPWPGMGPGMMGNGWRGLEGMQMGLSWMFNLSPEAWQVYDAVAVSLRLTPTQLFEQLHSGKTLQQIADMQGVKIEDVMTAAQGAAYHAARAAIERAVQQGDLTRRQADQLLERLEQDGGMGRGLGRWRGFFRNFPFFWGQQQPGPMDF